MVSIVTDSASDLPPSVVSELGIHVVPAKVFFGRKKYIDGHDLSVKDFYNMLHDEYFHPITLPSSPLDFYKIYAELEQVGEDILVITLPESLSKYQVSAKLAAKHIENVRVRVYSSSGLSGYQGLLTIQAARLARLGFTIDEIIRELEAIRKRACFYAVLPSTDALVRGGRLPLSRGKLAGLLGLYPILTIEDDELVSFDAKRGFDKAYEVIMVDLQTKYNPEEPLMAMMLDSFNSHQVNVLSKIIHEKFNIVEQFQSRVGATIGVHAGENAVAFALSPVISELLFN